MKKISNILVIVLLAMATPLTCLMAQSPQPPQLNGLEIGYYKTDIEYVKCSLHEPFAPDQYSYTATVDQMNTASMFVTPHIKPEKKGVQIRINGIYARPGERYKLDIKPGVNQVEISVSSADGIKGIYVLNINRTDLSSVYVADLIADGVWRIADFGGFPGGENMYLVEGKDKALLFDTGMGKGDLAGFVKSLTKLPVEVAITHSHRDHIGQNDQFKGSAVYMDQDDLYRVPKEMVTSKYKYVKEGDILDLGNRRFEVIELPGHSLGHLIFLDRENKTAVVGDIIGSGDRVHMQGSNRTTLEVYLQGLKRFEDKIRGMDGLTLLTGHFYQEKVPLVGVSGMQLATDMRILAEKILSGEVVGELTFSTRDGVTTAFRKAYYGLAGMYYNPDLK